MGSLLTLLYLALQEDALRIEGPPFLVFGESAEFRAVHAVKDATVVWRLSDGLKSAVEIKPSFDTSNRLRGPEKMSMTSVGQVDTQLAFSVTLERRGVRLASAELKVRIRPVIKVRTICRIVENPLGGTQRPDPIRDGDQRKELETGVNALLRPLGVEVALEEGRPVAAPDGWFDPEGRFHPIVLK